MAVLARLQQQARENPQYLDDLKNKIAEARKLTAQEKDPQRRAEFKKREMSLNTMLASLQMAIVDCPSPSLASGASNAAAGAPSTPASNRPMPPAPPSQPVQQPSGSSVVSKSISLDPPAVVGKRKLQDLVQSIDPYERLDVEVLDAMLELADEFIESVTMFAAQLAKHRGSKTLEVKDLQLHLERNYNIRVPGFFSTSGETVDMNGARKRPHLIHGHQTRLAAVRKAVFDEANKRDKNKEES
ncbi:Transcription initiation factor TFIID subunit 12 [Sorochytrium milnesiophthora]